MKTYLFTVLRRLLQSREANIPIRTSSGKAAILWLWDCWAVVALHSAVPDISLEASPIQTSSALFSVCSFLLFVALRKNVIVAVAVCNSATVHITESCKWFRISRFQCLQPWRPSTIYGNQIQAGEALNRSILLQLSAHRWFRHSA